MNYQKHSLNIFPEMGAEDFSRLKCDIEANGYDKSQPIWLFHGEIVDGWNRQRACSELGLQPVYKDFDGTEMEAIEFVMRTNKRRNLTSSQWAAIAVEADDIVKAIEEATEAARRAKIAERENVSNQYSEKVEMAQLIAPSPKTSQNKSKSESRTKIAKAFNTNRSYISDAKRLRIENPEAFKRIKSGQATITQVKKQAQIKKAKEDYTKAQRVDIAKNKPVVHKMSYADFLPTLQDNSVDLLITDPPYSTDVEDIAGFAQDWVPLALSKVKETGRAFICIGAYPKELQAYLGVLLAQSKFIVDNPLIWTYRNTLGITPKMKYNLNYQVVLHLYSEDSGPLDTSVTNEMFSVQDINAPDGRLGNRYHTWQKPDELSHRLVKHASKEGDKVVDCFACTGSFLIAAAKMNRTATGCDISHENLLIAQKRGCDYDQV